jgi:uncharacterized membrane protein
MGGMRTPRRVAGVAVLSLVASVVVLAGAVQKAPCANREYVEQRRGVTFQCYSDIAELLKTEQLLGSRLPFIDPCAPSADDCDEYPVLSMYAMRATAWLAWGTDPYPSFFWLNVVVLVLCAIGTVIVLERMGARTILFAGAPVLAIYGTMNWDLIPVLLATAGTWWFLRRRPGRAGVALGAGAAAKVYPALLAVPFAIDAWRQGRRRTAQALIGATAATWLAVNLPFAILGTDGWWTFFRFNAERPAEYDSLWRVACWVGVCAPTPVVNAASLLLTIAGTLWVWRARLSRDPEMPRWQLAFPLLVLFVLTNKVWSPQYGLWLLPWFALVAPTFRPYIALQAAEVLVFITRFSFFGTLQGRSGVSYSVVALALVLRAAALGWVLVEWVRTREPAPAGTQAVATT